MSCIGQLIIPLRAGRGLFRLWHGLSMIWFEPDVGQAVIVEAATQICFRYAGAMLLYTSSSGSAGLVGACATICTGVHPGLDRAALDGC